MSGKNYHVVSYGVDPETEMIDYDKVREIQETREKKKSLTSFNEHNLASVEIKNFDKL